MSTTPPVVTVAATDAPVSKSTMIIAATIGLLITGLILFIFYRVMQTLLRLRKASMGLTNMDVNTLKTLVGGDDKAAMAIKNGDDMLWLNLTLVGLTLAYGIGSVLGFVGSAVGLVRAITN